MEKEAKSLSGHKDNVYAFPPSGKENKCIKCEAEFTGEKCPRCGIPVIHIPRQNVYQFPVPKRPEVIEEKWFCSCGAENSEDMVECWKCDKPRPLW